MLVWLMLMMLGRQEDSRLWEALEPGVTDTMPAAVGAASRVSCRVVGAPKMVADQDTQNWLSMTAGKAKAREGAQSPLKPGVHSRGRGGLKRSELRAAPCRLVL
jgi:hypothetical protein